MFCEFCQKEIIIPASEIKIGDLIYYYANQYSVVTEIIKTNESIKLVLSSRDEEKYNGVCCIVITKKYSLDSQVKIYRNAWFC